MRTGQLKLRLFSSAGKTLAKNVPPVQMPPDPKYLPMTNTATISAVLLVVANISVNVYISLSILSNSKHHSEDDNVQYFF